MFWLIIIAVIVYFLYLSSKSSTSTNKSTLNDRPKPLIAPKQNEEIITPKKRPYNNKCWNCHTPVNESMSRCGECGWFVCPKCGACSLNNFHSKDKRPIKSNIKNNNAIENGFIHFVSNFTKKSLNELIDKHYYRANKTGFGEYGCFEYVTALLVLDYCQNSKEKVHKLGCEAITFILSECYSGRITPGCLSDFLDLIVIAFTDLDEAGRRNAYLYLKENHAWIQQHDIAKSPDIYNFNSFYYDHTFLYRMLIAASGDLSFQKYLISVFNGEQEYITKDGQKIEKDITLSTLWKSKLLQTIERIGGVDVYMTQEKAEDIIESYMSRKR